MDDKIKEKKTKRLIEKIKGLTTYVAKPEELAIYNYLTIDSEEAKLLIDYITNLQQENERLNHQLELQKGATRLFKNDLANVMRYFMETQDKELEK